LHKVLIVSVIGLYGFVNVGRLLTDIVGFLFENHEGHKVSLSFF